VLAQLGNWRARLAKSKRRIRVEKPLDDAIMLTAKWISTIEAGFSYDQAVKKGFWVR
jgi:hypothetical protein